MCGAMVHRGPDDEGIYLGDGVAIGMRRLSIIDLEQRPPAGLERRRIGLDRLQRRDLQLPGAAPRSDRPRPHLPHQQRHRNDRSPLRGVRRAAASTTCAACSALPSGTRGRARCCSRAIAWASSRSITPSANGELLFASELKPILQIEGVDRSLNWQAVGHLFTYLATPADQSIVDGVKKLEPARVAVARARASAADSALLGRRLRAERERDRGRARRAAAGDR